MGVLVPFSITTQVPKMKSMLVFAALLAVGFAAEEAKAPVVVANPYFYGFPGYYNAPLNYAPYAHQVVSAPVAAPVTTPVAAPITTAYALPQTYAPAYTVPAAPVPAPVVSSQFAAQDEFGNSEYGYSNVNSQKHEVGNGYTGVSGSYQYVDPAGKLQTVNYVADALGFRVADSRLPVHDAALPVAPVYDGVAPEPVVYDGVAPEPVVDTPEVAAAKAEFLKTFEEVASRQKRESDPALIYGYNSPYVLHARFRPVAYNGIYAYNRLGYMGYPRFNYGYYF